MTDSEITDLIEGVRESLDSLKQEIADKNREMERDIAAASRRLDTMSNDILDLERKCH